MMKEPNSEDPNLVLHEGRRGKLVRIKPGEKPPPGAVAIHHDYLAQLRQGEVVSLPLPYSWSSKYGQYITSASSGLFLGILTYTLRWKLKLYGGRGAWAGFGGVPAGAGCIQTLILSEMYIQKNVYEDKTNCEVCWPLKAAVVNAAATFLPMTLVMYSAFHHARRLATYDLPKLFDSKENNRLLIKIYRDIMRPYKRHYMVSGFILLLTPFLVTLHQQYIVKSLNQEKFVYPSLPKSQKTSKSEFSSDNSQTLTDDSNSGTDKASQSK